jgi:hypothetical protein
MQIFSVKNIESLQKQNETQKYISEQLKDLITTDILETEVLFSFQVFDKSSKKTLSFWQYIKPAII